MGLWWAAAAVEGEWVSRKWAGGGKRGAEGGGGHRQHHCTTQGATAEAEGRQGLPGQAGKPTLAPNDLPCYKPQPASTDTYIKKEAIKINSLPLHSFWWH